jgi:hypothetical protein
LRFRTLMSGTLCLHILPEHECQEDQDDDPSEVPEALHKEEQVFKKGFHGLAPIRAEEMPCLLPQILVKEQALAAP